MDTRLVVRAGPSVIYVCTEYNRSTLWPEGCARFHFGGIHSGPLWYFEDGPRRWWWSKKRLTFEEALDKARQYIRRMAEVEAVIADVQEVDRIISEL